ncbi:AAA family ATPase [Candidatus Thorarchaeota archaeon]|nr:MAG: AAA family ATPase [Candidatus Thorarchaeota archaeon]
MQRTHKLWVEQYRPKVISEYIFHDPQQRASVMRMINDKSIPHLLFSGVQGSGKTTLAHILIREMGTDSADWLIINASDERGIDTFRDKVKSFATTMPLGIFKIVLLEEADALTPDAQQALKRFMEEYADVTRFILTCNYENKIIPPIKSRCQHFHFKAADKNDIAEYLINILAQEQVGFDLNLLDKYITYGYPDIRKIVNMLQQNAIEGKLQIPKFEGTSSDYKFKLIDLVERDKWLDARKLVCGNVTSDEWEDVYRFLYENISRAPKFQQKDKWEEAIIVVAEHLYKHSIVADPEINAAAMFIRLGQL